MFEWTLKQWKWWVAMPIGYMIMVHVFNFEYWNVLIGFAIGLTIWEATHYKSKEE